MERIERSGIVRVSRFISSCMVPCYFILFMALFDTHGDHLPPTASFPHPLFEFLDSAGYTHTAALLRATGIDLATFRNLTIFAAPDHAPFPIFHSHALPDLFHFDASPQRLSYDDLVSMRSSDRIPSLEPGRNIVVSKNRGSKYGGGEIVTLNGRALVVFPDLYSDANVVVHGIDSFFRC